ncbi:MAG: elongation factor G [Firmicutes bacterium]|nr:elongation factor G [Bacillota bacterium]
MNNFNTGQIRNIGLFGHGGVGKTSLVEAMLFNTGVINRLGRVEDGTTVADYHPEEAQRQSTVHTSLVPVEAGEAKLNFLDTPGFSDFIGEVKGALRVVDSGLFVFSAVDGVQVQHELIWRFALNNSLPRIVFVNKMDRENASFTKLMDGLNDKFNGNFVPVNFPVGEGLDFKGIVDVLNEKAYQYDDNGQPKEMAVPGELQDQLSEYREKLIEAAAEGDDDLTMKYLEGEELTPEEIRTGLQKSIATGKAVPVLCGSATKNMAITDLTGFLAAYPPAPQCQDGGSMAALVFKTLADPYVGRMNFLRVFSGTLKSDTAVYNPNREKAERIGQILFVRGKQSEPTTQVSCGDMAIVVKLAETSSGDTLCDKDDKNRLDSIDFPAPNYTVAIAPKSKNDEDKLGDAVQKLLEEDPSLRVEKNTETKQTLLTGMGEAHVNIMISNLKRRFGVDVLMEEPKVPYRESIRGKTEVEGKHKKQSGGRGQYGHVWIRFESSEGDFEFKEEVFGGAVPRNYFPAVEKGLREAMAEGVLAGYPTVGIKATLYDGSYHSVDSSEMAFKIAASLAFKKAVPQSKPVLLEPIMNVEVAVPDEFMGDIIGDFNTKRGRVLGTDQVEEGTVVKAQVPLAEMFKYANDLKSMTQGRGQFNMEFSSYEEVPANLTEKIIQKAKDEAEK